MKRIKRLGLFFLIGAVGYAAIEIIWRGHTHWSMALAGGFAFVFFSIVAKKFMARSIFTKAAICAIGVTAIEFIFGVIFNLWLKMGVWDYSYMPLNLLGQICPAFMLIWLGLAIVFLPFVEILNRDYA